VTTAGSGIWGVNGRGQLFRLEWGTDELAGVFQVDGAPSHIVAGEDGLGELFATAYHHGSAELLQIAARPRACIQARYEYPSAASDPWMLSYAAESVWAGNQQADTLVRFDFSSTR
jgi:hypothetical protein